MQNTEQLKQGLGRALYFMQRMGELDNQREAVRSQYRQEMVPIRPTAKMLIVLIISAAVFFMAEGVLYYPVVILVSIIGGENWESLVRPALLISFVVVSVLTFLVSNGIRKKKIANQNKDIAATNERIRTMNSSTYDEEVRLIAEMQEIHRQYQQEIAPWYPPNYAYYQAAQAFLDYVGNYRANTIQDAVNLYEDELHKRTMVEKQDAMIQQQKLGNMLAIGSLIMQAGTISAIQDNTAAVDELGRAFGGGR